MIKQYFSRTLLFLILCIFTFGKSYSLTSVTNNNKPFVVIIDAGHGGKDPGAVSKGIREKDVVLAIGLKLGQLINENFPEVKVIFTRNTDVFVPLIDRSKIANKNKADLFISLHANFCGTPAIRGTETYFLGVARSDENFDVAKKENSVILLEDNYDSTYEGFDPNSAESYIMFTYLQSDYLKQSLSFADAIQNQFKSKLDNDNRGVKQAGFLVLRMSSMPSVLVETGFISNPSEANYLSSYAGQETIAQSIFEAFKKFKAKNSGVGTPILAENKTVATNHQNASPTNAVVENVSVQTENQKDIKPDQPSEEKKPEPITTAKTTVSKTEVIPENKPAENISNIQNDTNTYFSVQIGANTTPVEPTPANFKGLKEVRREKSDKYYRYFIGNEASVERIIPIWKQIKLKFPQAFIVSFVNGKRIILDNLPN